MTRPLQILKAIMLSLALMVSAGTVMLNSDAYAAKKIIKELTNDQSANILSRCLHEGKVNTKANGDVVCCTSRYCIKCPSSGKDMCTFYEERKFLIQKNRPQLKGQSGKVSR